MVVALAYGTSYCLSALPGVSLFRLSSGNLAMDNENDRNIYEMQLKIMEIAEMNRLLYEDLRAKAETEQACENAPCSEDEKFCLSEKSESDESAEIVEIDDEVDEDLISILLDSDIPSFCKVVVGKTCHPSSQFFTVAKRVPFSRNFTSRQLSSLVSALFAELFAFSDCVGLGEDIDLKPSFYDDGGWTVQLLFAGNIWQPDAPVCEFYKSPTFLSSKS